MKYRVIVIMGSQRDLDFCKEIGKHLEDLGIDCELRVASAHKTPEKVLAILKEHEKENTVYITVAGRSNALSAFVDANTPRPVIACPPYSDRFSGVDIYSSLRVPSGIASLVTLEPESAAIAAAKILAVEHAELLKRVERLQNEKKKEIEKADETARKIKQAHQNG